MRFSRFLFLGLALAVAPAWADRPGTAEDRQEFRNLLGQVAERSRLQPLPCKRVLSGGEAESVAFALSLKDNPDYRDAFFLVFDTADHSRSFSTLIAYEGNNGFVMGNLMVRQEHGTLWYQHAFSGFLTDVTDLVTKEGALSKFRYTKLSQGRAIEEIDCPLVL